MINKIKNNYFFILENVFVLGSFLVTLYAAKNYETLIYAEILFLTTIINNTKIFANLLNPKTQIVLEEELGRQKLFNLTFQSNLTIGLIVSFILLIMGLFFIEKLENIWLLLPALIGQSIFFLRFLDLGTDNGNSIFKYFLISSFFANSLRLIMIYYVVDIYIFLFSYIIETSIWFIALFIKNIELFKNFSTEPFSQIKFFFKRIFPTFFSGILNTLFDIIIISFIYSLLDPIYLIYFILGKRILEVSKNFIYSVDILFMNILKTIDKIGNIKYFLFLEGVTTFVILAVLIIVNYVLIPFLGKDYFALLNFLFLLLPLLFFQISISFYENILILKKMEFEFLKLRVFQMSLSIVFVFFIKSINDLIIIMYFMEIFYFMGLFFLKKNFIRNVITKLL